MVKKVTMVNGQLEFSELVQGYWRLAEWGMTPQQRLTFLEQHLALGITTVDHADIYGGYQCEALFGEALALKPSLREQLQIVTKCDINLCNDKYPHRQINYYDTSKQHIIESVNNSLANLRTDYIDLLLIHRSDLLMDADEVADAFMTLKQQGKVNHFGVSNFKPYQFDLLQSRLDVPLVTNQIEINPLNFDVAHDGTLDQLQMKRIRPMAWSCLAGGDIFTGHTEKHKRIRQELINIADELGGISIESVVYAWVRRLPSNPLVLVGSGTLEMLKLAVMSLDVTLSREQFYRIWVAAKGYGVP